MQKNLTTREAEKLLAENGLNQIAEHKKGTLFQKFIEQISSFLMILLIGASVVSFFIGEPVDGSLILLIIFLNAAFGIYQEYKAEEAVAALKKMTVSNIRVIRNNKEQEIDSRYLVPGDIILVEEGIKLPADAQILENVHLEINEAALTGESIPVVKAVKDPLFMGTIVAKGRGVARVTATGMKTKFGQIAEQLASVEEPQTPLQQKLNHLTEIIGLAGILLSFAVFALSSFQGYGYFPSFLLAISLAVAVVPESLPAVMTVILSIGVKHMAKRKAIIRKLGAIEALGSITLIATDKTGTLTTNVMEVKEVWFDETVTDFAQLEAEHAQSKELPSTLQMLIKNGVLCSTATLVSVREKQDNLDPEHSEYEVLGDPTEGSLLKLAKKLSIDPDALRKEWHLIDEIPFDSIKKRMTVMAEDGNKMAFSKGAPESILEISSKILIKGREVALTEARKKEITVMLREWAAHGLRVLAFSYVKGKNLKEVEKDNVFIGMAAIHDPPRKEAADALKRAYSAGIKVVMITGDNGKTAEAIGSSIGLLQKGEAILTGDQVEAYTDQELLRILPHTKIFARVTPFHKSRIVSLYQKLGEVVAVTGDGVNDSIALKQADVGIAMGKIGTDVARETADMVITDDNFATIVNAVDEGRNIVKRLKSSIKYLLTGNLSEGLVLLTGLLLGLPHIFLPIQLLYINLVSDGIPALTFAFAPRDERVMKQKPGASSLLPNGAVRYIITGGLAATAIVVSLFYWLMPQGELISRAGAFSVMALIQTSIFVDIWFSHKSGKNSINLFFTKLFMLTVLFPIVGQLIILRVPFIAEVFHITTVSYGQFLLFFVIAASLFVVRQVIRKVGGLF